MNSGVGIHSVDDAQIVCMLCRFGEQFGNAETAFTMLPKAEDGAGMLLLSRLRFVIKRVEVSWASAHAQKDYSLGTSGQWRRLRF